MSNMSYCRFENTARDLDDCYDNINKEHLSKKETKARKTLIELCVSIALDYGNEVDKSVILDV